MADLARFSALFIILCSSPESLHSSQERKKHLGTFSVHVRLMVLELASLEKKKEERKKERKKMTIFDFSFSRLL